MTVDQATAVTPARRGTRDAGHPPRPPLEHHLVHRTRLLRAGALGVLITGLIVALVLGDQALKQWRARVTTPYAHFAESYDGAR